MGQFQLWFAYYDSRFLMEDPHIPLAFIYEKVFDDQNWPQSPCKALSECMSLLETFIKNSETWEYSRCTHSEIEGISCDLNKLLFFVQVQKNYANKFWQSDFRRVEASLTHLYFFLQQLIKSLIPYPNMNLFQCKASSKLCLKLQKLQQLFNLLMKKINSISEFLAQPEFREQEKLIYNFFQNFISFIKKAPKIRKNQLPHIQNLTKFIVFNNPLEITKRGFNTIIEIRKKSNTLGTGQKKPLYQFEEIDWLQKTAEEIKKSDKRSKSHFHWNKNRSDKDKIMRLQKNFPKIFQFPNKKFDRRNSKQSRTAIISPKFLACKAEQIKKLNSSPNITSPKKSKSVTVKIHEIIYKKPVSKRTTENTTQSKKSMRNKRKLSVRSRLNTTQQDERKQFQLTRASTYYPTIANQIIKVSFQVKQCYYRRPKLDIQSGNVILGRGWRILREYFWSRVQENKIRKLLLTRI